MYFAFLDKKFLCYRWQARAQGQTCCFLCHENISPADSGRSMKNLIIKTQHSYREVITKLFQKERLQSYMDQSDFSKENLCSKCVSLVDDLFRLQYQLRLKKNEIVAIFKSSKIRAETVIKEIVVDNKENHPNIDTPVRDKVSTKEVHDIETILKKREDKFLVKWKGLSNDESTWETRNSIPDAIIKFFENNPKKYGQPYVQAMENVTIEVEAVLDKREKGKKTEYLVKWKDYDQPSDNTWETAKNLGKSVIEDFEKKISEKQKEVEDSKNDSSPSDNRKRKSKEIPQTTPKKNEKKEKSKKVKQEEYMIEMLVKREGNKYLVKWENFPMAQNTWEPRSSIPEFILEVMRFEILFRNI